MDDGGTSLANSISTWVPVLSVALMIIFAVLAARRSAWCWLAAGLSGLATIVPYFAIGPGPLTFGLWPLTLLTLLVPLLGWWIWSRLNSRPGAEKIPVRHAGRKDYLIAAVILAIPALIWIPTFLSQASLTTASAGQIALTTLGLFMSGGLLVALLGFAWGRMESWWLLLADSAWYLVGSAAYLVPALLGVNDVVPPGVSLTARAALAAAHVGIIVAAVLGYRSWKRGVSTTPRAVPLQGNL